MAMLHRVVARLRAASGERSSEGGHPVDALDRADETLARIRERHADVVTPDSAISPMDADNTVQLPRIGPRPVVPDGTEETQRLPRLPNPGQGQPGPPQAPRGPHPSAQPTQPIEPSRPPQPPLPPTGRSQPTWPESNTSTNPIPRVDPDA